MQKCFIITPPIDVSGYAEGHVSRVHDYILAPACRQMGYTTIRAGEAVYDDPMGILKEIIDCDMVLCDLSANNVNALYGLAVRKALGLPVVLVKDTKTILSFNTAELAVIDYDDSLRIDTVQREVAELGEALKTVSESGQVKHELLVQLGIPPMEAVSVADEPSSGMSEPEDSKHVLPIISPLPEYVGEPLTDDEIAELKEGDEFFHLNHGRGKVIVAKKSGQVIISKVEFDSGARTIIMAASNLLRRIKE